MIRKVRVRSLVAICLLKMAATVYEREICFAVLRFRGKRFDQR